MGKNKKAGDESGGAEGTAVVGSPEAGAPKAKAKAKKLAMDLGRETLKRLERFIEAYNDDPARMTPKTDADRVVNEALAAMLAGRPKG